MRLRIRGVVGAALAVAAAIAAGPGLSARQGQNAWSDYLALIPDNSMVRQDQAALLSDPVEGIGPQTERSFSQAVAPKRVRLLVKRDKAAGTVQLAFCNQTDGSFPATAAGNVTVTRSLNGGAVLGVKFVILTEPAIFIRAEPGAGGSLLSVYFKDNAHPLFQDLPLSLSIERVALTPIAAIARLCDAKVAWRNLLDRPGLASAEPVPSLAAAIRAQLKYLPDADDGAMDENGRLVRIAGLPKSGLPGFNCSGFLKWIADGFYYPLLRERTGTGSYLSIAELKERQLDARGGPDTEAYEESRDPFFGLDWTRNIAAKLYWARTGRAAADPEQWDVRSLPYLNYSEDKGYPVEWLRLALYLAALREPGAVYLGSVNGDWGSRPTLWQHYHVVAFFPWIDADGAFRCAVFERNVETSLDSLERRYPRDFMHLVRLRGMGSFEPVRIK